MGGSVLATLGTTAPHLRPAALPVTLRGEFREGLAGIAHYPSATLLAWLVEVWTWGGLVASVLCATPTGCSTSLCVVSQSVKPIVARQALGQCSGTSLPAILSRQPEGAGHRHPCHSHSSAWPPQLLIKLHKYLMANY